MPRPTRLLLALRARLSALGDPERARGARAYMKSAMPFHGVGAVPLRAACRELFSRLVLPDADAFRREVLGLFRGAAFREERYAAVELARWRGFARFRGLDFLPVCEEMVVTGAWWDVVDPIAAHLLGELLAKEPRATRRAMLAWARSDDLWKRRSAILCQLGSRGETDPGLLFACIEPSLASKEFFLRKAIGWALRQYARADPTEVSRYVAANAERLSPLSRREALKHVGRPPVRRDGGGSSTGPGSRPRRAGRASGPPGSPAPPSR
ncbi:MAG: DNA alkylation repair protein [Thermoanaerobaculia bacterium]|nr:DNA alkylation repair protein [Thermoanaerobaculia bacterium]